MKYLFVINPVSGDLDKQSFREHLRAEARRFALDIDLLWTNAADDLVRIRDRVAAFGPDRVAAVGGDGTFQMVATALMEYGIPVGIIPMGSANGMARELGLPQAPEAALQVFWLSQHTPSLDVITIDDRHYCFHFADIGFNARLVEDFQHDEERGLKTYARYLLRELPQQELMRLRLEVGGKVFESAAYMVVLANARRFGTGVLFNPQGDLFDGRFEVVLVEEITLGGLLKAGLSTISDVDYGDLISVHACNSVTLELEKPATLQIDGEVIGPVRALKARMRPQALPVIVEKRKS
jgi:diacylglycerol kinase family enzyme